VPEADIPDPGTVYDATLVGREDIHPGLRIVRVRPDAGSVPDFVPGQYTVLGLLGSEPRVAEADVEDPPTEPGKLLKRAYSIASSNLERNYVEFFLTLVTSGALTPRLFALEHGARLFLSPRAVGTFTLDRVAPGKAIVMVATGTGLAPYMSMLRTTLVHDAERRFAVLHGARYSWDLGYRAELESLQRIRPNLRYIPSITRPDRDPHFAGRVGRLQQLLADGVVERESGIELDPERTDVFLCGNPDMIREVQAMLTLRGYRPGRGREPGTVHVEEYW
jgi:ferredoxin--NADP+ reductase